MKCQQSLHYQTDTAVGVSECEVRQFSPRGCLLVNTESRSVDVCFVEELGSSINITDGWPCDSQVEDLLSTGHC